MLSTTILVLSIVACVSGHSWIACTDYAEKNADYWDAGKCRGFPRMGHSYTPKDDFGSDKGYDYHATESNPCKLPRNDGSNYNQDYPMATYFPGQQVILAHPMKNHGADTKCTNPYIPDNGNNLYMAPKESRGDVSLSEFKRRPVADLGKSPTGYGTHSDTYPKPGFQNAPKFCENTDRALGTYSFNVPTHLTPGVYTFLWTWGFNSKNDLYSTCFEIEIASKRERDDELRSRGLTTSVVCGGETSDFSVRGSSVGCDGGSVLPVTTTRPPTPPRTTRRPATTRRPIFTRPRTTTTTASTHVAPGEMLVVNMRQLAGSIELPPADKSLTKRVISLHFDCPVRANFWPVSSVTEHNHGEEKRRRKKRHSESIHHEITLFGRTKVDLKKIYYHATFSRDCNVVLYPPIAKLVSEE